MEEEVVDAFKDVKDVETKIMTKSHRCCGCTCTGQQLFVLVASLCSVASSSWSFASTFETFEQMAQHHDTLKGVYKNWRTPPLLNVTLERTEVGCMDGWETLGLSERDGQPLRVWRSHVLCIQRGEAAAGTSKVRPVLEDNKCPDGYVSCSAGSVCHPNLCPVTAIQWHSTNGTQPLISVERSGSELPAIEVVVESSPLDDCDAEMNLSIDQQPMSAFWADNQLQAQGSQTAHLLLIRQIRWKSDCVVGMQEVLGHWEMIEALFLSQLVLLVCNGVCGLLILGTVFPVLKVYEYWSISKDLPCCPGRGKKEQVFFSRVQMVAAMIAKVIKITPLCACLVASSQLVNYWSAILQDDCTDCRMDLQTIHAFVRSIFQSNVITLVIDVIWIVYHLVVMHRWSKHYGPAVNKSRVKVEVKPISEGP